MLNCPISPPLIPSLISSQINWLVSELALIFLNNKSIKKIDTKTQLGQTSDGCVDNFNRSEIATTCYEEAPRTEHILNMLYPSLYDRVNTVHCSVSESVLITFGLTGSVSNEQNAREKALHTLQISICCS